MNRQLVTVDVVRHDGTVSRYQVEHEDHLTVTQLLEKIYLGYDTTLAYRHFCCNIGRCASCLVKVNGKNVQGCKHVVEAGAVLRIEAADEGRAIRDLVIDFGTREPKSRPVRVVEV